MNPDRFSFIVPARGGSKRLPRKNVLELAGRPILDYTLEAAMDSQVTTRVILSTDDDEIASIGESAGVEIHWRTPDLCTDAARMQHVCRAVVDDQFEQGKDLEGFCCLVPTAPLRLAEDIRGAWSLFTSDDVDFVMGAAEFHYTPWQAMEEQGGYAQLLWPEYRDTKSQAMPPTFADNGSMYWAKIKAFVEEDTFFGRRLKPYHMPKHRSVDLDTVDDLLVLKRLMSVADEEVAFV